MRYNILDSFISTLLVYFLLPRYAVAGYIFMLYFSEMFNFSLSIHRLAKVTEVNFSFSAFIKAILAIFGAVQIALLFMRQVGQPLCAEPLNLILHIALAGFIYFVLLRLMGAFGSNDMAWFKAIFRRHEAK